MFVTQELVKDIVNGVKVKYEIKPRRAGDIATCYADPTRAKEELGWVATRGIDEMCRDTWNFAKTRMKQPLAIFFYCLYR